MSSPLSSNLPSPGRLAGTAGTVLLAEDDELVASALTISLEREGYHVVTARNVGEALEKFSRIHADVVVTDLLMPGGTGLDLLKELETANPDIPVIIVTADQSVEAAAEAVREHAFDYLTKPVSRDALTETVSRAVASRRERQAEVHEQDRLKEEHRRLAIRHQRTAMLLQVLYDRAVEGILVLDEQGQLVDASESFVALVGKPLYELLDTDVGSLFDRHPTEGHITDRIERLSQAPLSQGHWRGDVTVRATRDRKLPAKLSLSVCETPAVDDAAERSRYIIALIYYDTAYEELSRQLQQADRLATIGLLAGSAAHEIKNELGPLLGYLTMIERGGSDPVESGMIKIMRDSVRRVHEHVEQILTPLRPRVRTRGAVVLKEQIEGILVLLRRAGKVRRINIDVSGGDDVVIHADKDEAHQIALNLITNAIDALGDGAGGDRGSISIRMFNDGDFGVLEVEDTGEGIPEKLRSRIFEPFFTTKGSGGTGLGLPVVHDIVRTLRGRVSLDSSGETGTVVTVKIPRYRG